MIFTRNILLHICIPNSTRNGRNDPLQRHPFSTAKKKSKMGGGDQYLSEVEKDPFDSKGFVERLTWKIRSRPASQATKQDFNFDPLVLHDAFEQAIRDLSDLYESTLVQTEKLEMLCKDEEKELKSKIQHLQQQNKASLTSFQELDERINYVATKVVHLGDQLESINMPRARAVEAQKLINYFGEFLNPGPLISEVFTDKSQLHDAADVIQKLNMVAEELTLENLLRFDAVKKRISDKYEEIEKLLIDQFKEAHITGNREEMKQVALILSPFKHYSECIAAFIKHSQGVMKSWKEIFPRVLPLCKTNYAIMNEVFVNPNQVMLMFILCIYQKKLREHIQLILEDKKNTPEKYLENLFNLYCETVKLSNDLSEFNFGNDPTLLHKVTKSIFGEYLNRYIMDETDCLKDKFEGILQKYYNDLKHQKKPIQSGALYDLKRTFQTNKATTATLSENYSGQLFLSDIVSMSLIQKTKMALRRCQVLSAPLDLAANSARIFNVLLHYLHTEYIEYALEIGIQNIPTGELKDAPKIYFFDVVRECTTSMQLFDKMFVMNLSPLTINSSRHAELMQKKKNFNSNVEQKIDIGIERSLAAIFAWISHILKTEQKKTDFKPENKQGDDQSVEIAQSGTEACMKIVKFLNAQVKKIKECFVGKNVDAILSEVGIRFHRLIFEHLQQIQYNEQGAILLIFDVNEYRKCVQNFHISLVDDLWESLFALCNLFVVPAASLDSICQNDLLAHLDKTVIRSFIQLRPDQKSRLLNMKLNYKQ
uniref:Exocyst complex component 5 n=1 Tax=Strigamia maritima TaxID=126957 RepID=T1J593_STRMM